QDRGRDSGCTPGSDMAHCDAAGVNWGQPHTLSWRPATAGDAEWMFGKSRTRLAPVLTEPPSWMDVGPTWVARITLVTSVEKPAARETGPIKPTGYRPGRKSQKRRQGKKR